MRAEVWLSVANPTDGARHELPVDLVEARGYAWTGESPYLDVVILLDLSASTLLASGGDVDGDGRVGRIHPDAVWLFRGLYPHTAGSMATYEPRKLSSDLDDTVARAQLSAARRFVSSLDPARTRAALVTFAERPVVRAELTAGREELLAWIDRLERVERKRALEFEMRGTNLGKAIALGATLLLEPRPDEPPRRRELLVLTDGIPNLPHPVQHAVQFTAATAQVVSERGVGVHLFPLGPVALANATFFQAVAQLSGGSNTAVAASGEIVERMAQVRLDRLAELRVANRTRGEPARDLRVFADGSFDALLRLAPGANELEFHARDASGREATVLRTIDFAPATPASADEARTQRDALERFAERLRARAVETELVNEIARARDEAERTERRLALEVEDGARPAD